MGVARGALMTGERQSTKPATSKAAAVDIPMICFVFTEFDWVFSYRTYGGCADGLQSWYWTLGQLPAAADKSVRFIWPERT